MASALAMSKEMEAVAMWTMVAILKTMRVLMHD